MLFHYNGHGVPRPTSNGELWMFNPVRRRVPCAAELAASPWWPTSAHVGDMHAVWVGCVCSTTHSTCLCLCTTCSSGARPRRCSCWTARRRASCCHTSPPWTATPEMPRYAFALAVVQAGRHAVLTAV